MVKIDLTTPTLCIHLWRNDIRYTAQQILYGSYQRTFRYDAYEKWYAHHKVVCIPSSIRQFLLPEDMAIRIGLEAGYVPHKAPPPPPPPPPPPHHHQGDRLHTNVKAYMYGYIRILIAVLRYTYTCTVQL